MDLTQTKAHFPRDSRLGARWSNRVRLLVASPVKLLGP